MMIDSKGGDLQLGVCQHLLPCHARTIVASAPDPAGRVITIYVNAIELGELAAMINHTARERSRFGVRMLNRGRHGGSGTQLAVGIERMAAFIDAPSIVLAAPDEVGCFPKILAIIADPDL